MRHVLQAGVCLGLLWTLVVMQTGGVAGRIFGVRVSSRNPVGVLLFTAVLALGVWWFSRPDVRAAWRADRQALRRWISRASLSVTSIAVTAVAAWMSLRLIGQWLGARPLWLDEQMIALNVRDRSAAELIGPLWLDQGAPLGWLLAQRAVVSVLGDGEVALRLLPMAFAIATTAAAAWIGQRWMGTAGAVCLTLLAGASPGIAYYAGELKSYTADVFWALLLPALAVWTIEAPDLSARRRRTMGWWAAAALGQFTAYGAAFVAPGSVAVIAIDAWRRYGLREVLRAVPGGLLCLGAVGLHYVLSIRDVTGNDFLANYWASGLPPLRASVVDTVTWLINQLGRVANAPGGTSMPMLFWAVVITGWVWSRTTLGWLMASMPVMAVVFAFLRLVPLIDRLALWTMPAMFVGIALTVDCAVRAWRTHAAGGRPWMLALPTAALVAVMMLINDTVPHGLRELGRGVETNHGVDDRGGVRWLLSWHRPGDIVVTTALAQPAIWWYGQVPVGTPSVGAQLPDGSAIMRAQFMPGRARCSMDLLEQLPFGARLLIYLGFRYDDVPPGFDQQLLDTLGRIGYLVTMKEGPEMGRALIVERGHPEAMPTLTPLFSDEPATPNGCIEFVPAKRW
ncbi:MAG: hypothetical protein IT178_07390 [Acidobacteria bacterium]|nr:hypothetical protein [Acidobacteriota bacterium]